MFRSIVNHIVIDPRTIGTCSTISIAICVLGTCRNILCHGVVEVTHQDAVYKCELVYRDCYSAEHRLTLAVGKLVPVKNVVAYSSSRSIRNVYARIWCIPIHGFVRRLIQFACVNRSLSLGFRVLTFYAVCTFQRMVVD